jgi:hypothetical protein
MTFKKISISTFVFLIYATIGFSQKNNIIYTQFTGKNSAFSMNYDRKLGAYHDETGQYSFYGHVGIGTLSSQELMTTKFIKGSLTNANTGSLPLDIIIGIITYEPDKTLERRQFFEVTNYSLGGKILLGKGKLNVIVGLDARYDRVEQRIEPWESTPAQTINFGKTYISPSVGLRLNSKNLMAQLVLAPQTIYGNRGGTDGVVNLGLGFQF